MLTRDHRFLYLEVDFLSYMRQGDHSSHSQPSKRFIPKTKRILYLANAPVVVGQETTDSQVHFSRCRQPEGRIQRESQPGNGEITHNRPLYMGIIPSFPAFRSSKEMESQHNANHVKDYQTTSRRQQQQLHLWTNCSFKLCPQTHHPGSY